MIHRTCFLFSVICGAIVILLVSACTATPISDPESLAQATPEVTIQGGTPGKEEVQTIELDNCGGKADATRIEQRTQSVDVTISTEVAGKIGASVEVVSAEVQAAVGLAITPGSERSTSIQLVAPPDTRMLFELVWVGNEQIGVVQNIRNSDVPVAFRSFLPTDVRIRSQSDIGCSSFSSPQVVFEPTAAPIPEQTLIPANVGTWLHNINQIPATGTQLTWELNAGEVLILTGGRIRYSDFYCGDDSSQICVLIIHATRNQSITINDLIAQNNWLGVTSVFNSEEALSDVEPWFWKPPNCINGCSKATAAFFEDQQLTDSRIIQR